VNIVKLLKSGVAKAETAGATAAIGRVEAASRPAAVIQETGTSARAAGATVEAKTSAEAPAPIGFRPRRVKTNIRPTPTGPDVRSLPSLERGVNAPPGVGSFGD